MDDTYSGRELVESKREIDGGISIIFWKDDLISMSMLLNTLINHAKMKPFLKLNSSKYYPIEGIKLVAHELKKQESVFFGRAHKKNALVFSGYKPLFNHSSYIEEVLQAAEYYGGSDLIVTVSGVPSQTSHRDARNQIYIFNSERYKQTFQEKYKTLKTKPFSTSIGGVPSFVFLTIERMCPIEDSTVKSLPRYFSIVFAFAGDSTITRFLLLILISQA